jgi:hypothetical protein
MTRPKAADPVATQKVSMMIARRIEARRLEGLVAGSHRPGPIARIVRKVVG